VEFAFQADLNGWEVEEATRLLHLLYGADIGDKEEENNRFWASCKD